MKSQDKASPQTPENKEHKEQPRKTRKSEPPEPGKHGKQRKTRNRQIKETQGKVSLRRPDNRETNENQRNQGIAISKTIVVLPL